jgi:hypothetical protein
MKSNCWWGHREIRKLVHCWYECKVAQPPGKTIQQFLKKILGAPRWWLGQSCRPCELQNQGPCWDTGDMLCWNYAGSQPHSGSMPHQDSCLLGHAGSIHHWDPCPSAAPDPNTEQDLHPTGTPASRAMPCISSMPNPHTTKISALRAPRLSGPARPQLCVEWPEPYPTRIPTPQALLDPCSIGIPAPQSWAPAQHERDTYQSPPGSLPLR